MVVQLSCLSKEGEITTREGNGATEGGWIDRMERMLMKRIVKAKNAKEEVWSSTPTDTSQMCFNQRTMKAKKRRKSARCRDNKAFSNDMINQYKELY